MRLAILRIPISLVVGLALLLAGAGDAFAGEAQPLTIKSFRMEPTHATIEHMSGGEVTGFSSEPYGRPFTQAGGHPWGLTTTTEFETETVATHLPGVSATPPTMDPKDIVVDLPPGLLGDPMALPRCPLAIVTSGQGQCPADTQVGTYQLRWFAGKRYFAPIVNVVPEAGQSAEFALENTVKSLSTPLLTAHLVHTAAGYGFTVVSDNIPLVGLSLAELTFWGLPADPSHDTVRGLFCEADQESEKKPFACHGGGQGFSVYSPEKFGYSPEVPFLTLSTDCSEGPQTATLRADSWEEPGTVVEGRYSEQWKQASTTLPGATGCDALQFQPQIEVQPNTLLADEPVELGVNLKVPLNEAPGGLATPQLRDSSVTLPEGMSVNPSVVGGVRACEELGPEGIDITGPESETLAPSGELQLASGHCPAASTVGTAEAITPFLPVPVKGRLYLARPGCGNAALGQAPCTEQDALDGNLYRLYLELGGEGELAGTGIHFKVPMRTEANPATGQLTTVVLDTPQAPFSELKLRLNGGSRAPIANPAACGPATTSADFRPWSAPGVTPAPESLFTPGTPDATPFSTFMVSGCASPTPFAPAFTAGTVTPQAGRFTPFALSLSRQDREQFFKGIQVHTPPGLLGMLSSVPLCQEPAADAGTCPQSSKIGTTRVATGAGSDPFEIEGEVFLTGPYGGSPFGLSVVVHIDVGPFHLGVKVVRARIAVDPTDSTLTVTTDETGRYAVPQIVFGVPVRLKRLTVDIDRPGFMFNPTSCASQRVTAAVSGSQDATSDASSPFAVGGCRSLAFKPRFTASTNGHTSRKSGASLDVKLSYPKNSIGVDANVARVKVSLPKQLPSYLATLQKACLAATFAANPGACPKGSIVGIARAATPLLPVGLSGPAYFVSHGGEAFPSLVIVLQGDGVRVDLTGSTFIDKKTGITSSTFKTVPDVPVSSFELFLPQGANHALAANGRLCRLAKRLAMPTEFVAQNGAVLRQSTHIAAIGCRPRGAAASTSTARKGGHR